VSKLTNVIRVTSRTLLWVALAFLWVAFFVEAVQEPQLPPQDTQALPWLRRPTQ
jgi:hypothetical protein